MWGGGVLAGGAMTIGTAWRSGSGEEEGLGNSPQLLVYLICH